MNEYPRFCEIRGNRMEEANKHFRFCKARNIPYITIQKRKKYATIELDLIAQSFMLNESGQRLVGEIFIQESKSKQISLLVGRVYVYADKIPVEKAEQVAEDVFQVAKDPKYQQPTF